MNSVLSIILSIPLVGAILILCAGEKDKNLSRVLALVSSVAAFLLSSFLAFKFEPSGDAIQFEEKYNWIRSLNISYHLGLDGLSCGILVFAALLFLLAIVSAWNQENGKRGFFSLLLFLETSVLGSLLSQDLFLFFCFWMSSLLPIYFLISIWGGKSREYAALKFFIYQFIGCGFLLLAMFAIYYSATPPSFNLIDLQGGKFAGLRLDFGVKSFNFEHLVSVLLFLGFAVRIPLVPLHQWFIWGQTESPAPLAAILAACFTKLGVFGLLKINYSLFPEATRWFAPALGVMGLINILYGALCAFGQTDLRKLLAYGCLSLTGFSLVGFSIFSQTSFQGAWLHLISEGICMALLFFLVGIISKRIGHVRIQTEEGNPGIGGLVGKTPILTAFFIFGAFSVIGVPGLGMFVPQSFVFLGVFPAHRLYTILSLLGVILTAGYMLWTFQRVFLGKSQVAGEIKDLTWMEKAFLIPLVALSIFVGSYPEPLLHLSEKTVKNLLKSIAKDTTDDIAEKESAH